MFCIKCGADLPNDAKICSQCGASIEEMYNDDVTDEIEENSSENISITYKEQAEQNYDWGKTVVGKTAETSRKILRVRENADFSFKMGVMSLAFLIVFGLGAIFGIFAILRAKKVFLKLPNVLVSSKTEVKFLDKANEKAQKGKLFGMISCIVGPIIFVLSIIILIIAL